MFLLYHAYVYLEFLILACTIYILAPYTLLISITRDIVVPLAYIIVSAMSKYKKSKFKYNGIELEGYSADEIEKILTVIAQKNDLLKGNSKKGNV